MTERTNTLETNTLETNTLKASLEASLAIHNANHPESPLTDITDALSAAKQARLIALLRRHYAHNPKFLAATADWNVSNAPAGNFILLCLVTALALVPRRISMNGEEFVITTDEIIEVLDTRRPRPVLTPQKRRFLDKAVRATHLLDRTLAIGCLKRGEV